MAFDALEIRISLQKLLIALILVIVPLSFVGLYLTSEADVSLERNIGEYLSRIAQTEAMATAQFIDDRVVDVDILAGNPAVIEAIAAAKRAHSGLDDASIAARIAKIEGEWETPQSDPLIKELLASPASQSLKRYREAEPRLLKILVADGTGATVAATDRPLHYVQPSGTYWQTVYGGGQGSVYVSGVLYDEESKSLYLSIGAPVLAEGTRRFNGAVNALVDVSSLVSHFNRATSGGAARTLLLSEDGSVVSAPSAGPSPTLKSEEYAAARDALGTLQGKQRGYVVVTMRQGNRIVGFADTGLKSRYTTLGWIVLVSQDERQALAPLRTVGHFALLTVVLALFMLTLLSVYFFLHRKQRLEDIEPKQEEPPNTGNMAA